MSEEKMGEIPEKTGENTEKLERVALCLECSNEWIARNGMARKPSKCPECGTKRCTWKDSQPKAEGKPTEEVEKQGEVPENAEEKTRENEEGTGEKQEKIERKPRKNGEKKPVVVETVNSPVFLPENTKEKEGEIDEEKFQLPETGMPLILMLGLLLVMGIIGGALWFLGRSQKLGAASNPAIPRTPTKTEWAMKRIGGGV